MDSHELRRAWLDGLRPGSVQGLFEYLPDTLYFAKDAQLRLMAGNRAFVKKQIPINDFPRYISA